jgi:GDPmannose 4,6-dehydratase
MRPTEIAASRGDYSKAKAELGWEPRMQFKELIELMVNEDIRRMSTKREK